ncbi:hypothetical protein ACLOJK_008973 [Asimina triloba]
MLSKGRRSRARQRTQSSAIERKKIGLPTLQGREDGGGRSIGGCNRLQWGLDCPNNSVIERKKFASLPLRDGEDDHLIRLVVAMAFQKKKINIELALCAQSGSHLPHVKGAIIPESLCDATFGVMVKEVEGTKRKEAMESIRLCLCSLCHRRFESSSSPTRCFLLSTLVNHRPKLILQLEYGPLEELVSTAKAGSDGLLGGERVSIADGGEQLIDGLEEDSGVSNFRLDGAIRGDEGGDSIIEGFDGLVEGEGIIIAELVMGEASV